MVRFVNKLKTFRVGVAEPNAPPKHGDPLGQSGGALESLFEAPSESVSLNANGTLHGGPLAPKTRRPYVARLLHDYEHPHHWLGDGWRGQLEAALHARAAEGRDPSTASRSHRLNWPVKYTFLGVHIQLIDQ